MAAERSLYAKEERRLRGQTALNVDIPFLFLLLLILAVGLYAIARLSCFCVNTPVKSDDSGDNDPTNHSENQQFEK